MFPETFRPEPRCHVCRTEHVRVQVNAMLIGGSSYAQIVRAVAADGTDEVSLDSVRNHANRHFPVQNVAQAAYREILERRAAQNQIDFVNGLATAITPMAYLETVVVKGFQNLVRDDTEVTIEMGLKAAEKLHAAVGPDDTGAKILQMRVQMGRLIDAVQAAVPQSTWAEIAARLNEPAPGRNEVFGSETVEPQQLRDPDEEVRVFDPGDDGDDDF